MNTGIIQASISDIRYNPKNPRTIKDDKFKKLCQSIMDFPDMLNKRPLVCYTDENGKYVVLGGNMRLKAAKELKYKILPIVLADDWDDNQKSQFLIKDNIGFGDWNWDELKADWDIEKLEQWGLDIPNFEPEVLEAEEDNFDVPEGGIETDIVLGDLFEIGEHRLLCGDSTNSDQVAKLMNGQKADLLFTDPPYNVSFNGRSGKFDVIENDDLTTEDFDKFIQEFAQTVHTLQIPIKYIWCNWRFYGTLQKHFELNACIVWAKNVFGLGRGYRHQHEFCFFEGKLDDGINNESDLWEIKKDRNYIHPTQKPIELSARALSNHKNAKNILDLFGGSGSTLVGIHQLKRIGYLMELDPKYCQVIVDRMIKLDPSIQILKNGQKYDKK
jgi:DNA modification methylase